MNFARKLSIPILVWMGIGLLVLVAFVAGRMTGRTPVTAVAHNDQVLDKSDSQTVQMYTCSMHPHVRSPNPNDKCPICGMDLIPVPSDGDDHGDGELPQLRLSPRAVALMNIQTWPAERRTIEVPVRLFGRIEADETRLRSIAAWVPGRLDRLYVDFTGVQVQQGDPMVEIYSPRLIAAQEELLQARRGAEDLQRSGLEIIRETSEATLLASREKLRLLGLAPEQIEQIERAGKVTDHLVIHAPVGGVVTERLATQGAYVETGHPIYRIADLSQVWVNLEVYESDLQWLQLGQEAVFTTEAFPGEQFTGQIAFIHPVLDQATRTVRVRLNAPNPDGRLKPGMFARGTVHARIGTLPLPVQPEPQFSDQPPLIGDVPEREPAPAAHPDHKQESHDLHQVQAQPLPPRHPEHDLDTDLLPLVIPASAPLLTGRRAVVYVRLPETERPTFEARNVVLGPRAGDYYLVREGLAEGELVVTHGNFKIDSELQIRGRPSMMAPEGGAPPAHDHGSLSQRREKAPALDVPAEFRESLAPVYAHYLEAQTALAADELAGFQSAAKQMRQAVQEVSAASLSDVANSVWRALARQLQAQSEHIDHISDLESARTLFGSYSDAALKLVERYGYFGEEALAVGFCPMAKDKSGGLWLQAGEEIVNPYMGPRMLRCGELLTSNVTNIHPDAINRSLGEVGETRP
jgi:membrane fusion protein, copper/silver efflux system